MGYRLVQLARGSYDVQLEGEVVASLVQSRTSKRWHAELLDEREPRPAFKKPEHTFDSFAGAIAWLGEQPVGSVVRFGRRQGLCRHVLSSPIRAEETVGCTSKRSEGSSNRERSVRC